MVADTNRRGLLGSAATAGLLGLPGCLGATPLVSNRSEETQTVPLEDATAIAIESDVGRISVTGADRDDGGLEVVKESESIRTDLEDLTLETERTDGRLEVRSEWDGSEGWLASRPSMDLDVEIPREVALERVETSTGRIIVRDVTGDLRADASTGRVDVAGVDGTVTGETTISASTGRVTAAVSQEVDADLRVRTSTGRIDVDDLSLENATRGEDSVAGRLGDGGPRLRIETSTGRVTVEPLE